MRATQKLIEIMLNEISPRTEQNCERLQYLMSIYNLQNVSVVAVFIAHTSRHRWVHGLSSALIQTVPGSVKVRATSKDVIALAHTLTTTSRRPFIFYTAGEFLEHATSGPLSQKEKPLGELRPHSAGLLSHAAVV